MKSFREHVNSLPLEEQRAIRKAEKLWVTAHASGVADDPAHRDYEESFHGYTDPPAGTKDEYKAGPGYEPLLSTVPGYQSKRSASE
jgi:hypothetical protein